jgi:FkbM family methyltransferase
VISFLRSLGHNSEPVPGFAWRVSSALQRAFSRPPSETLQIVLQLPQKSRNVHERRKQWTQLESQGCKYVLASHGAFFLLNVSDKVISPKIFESGKADFLKYRAALKILKLQRVDCLVDVGANIGEIGILALTQQRAKKVVAIEPDEENFKLLETNALLNHLSAERMQMYCAAAGSGNPKEVVLKRSSTNYGDHQIDSHGQARIVEGSEARMVANLRLDDIVKPTTTQTALLFIDVQGYELQVLQGAPALLRRRVPLVIEISPSHLEQHGSFAELVFLLRGYEGYYDLGLHRPTKQNLTALEQRYLRLKHLNMHTDILIV